MIYHPLYGMNNYVLIWGDWISCDPLGGSHDSQSPHIRKHSCPTLIYLLQIYSCYLRGDRSPLNENSQCRPYRPYSRTIYRICFDFIYSAYHTRNIAYMVIIIKNNKNRQPPCLVTRDNTHWKVSW